MSFGMDNWLARLLNQPSPPEEPVLATPEVPSPLASAGRGMMDIVDPMLIGYRYLSDPTTADAYRQQKRLDEARYRRGSDSVGLGGLDPMRVLGRVAASGPFLGGIGAIQSAAGSAMGWDALQSTGRALYDQIPPQTQNELANLLYRRRDY